jgi:putative hemolysin
MRALSILAAPAVRFVSASTELIIRVLGIRPSPEPPISEEEIRILIEQGTVAGVFEEAEQDVVERTFRLGDRRVSALMVPRMDIVWLDVTDSPGEIRRRITESGHSLFPVCRETVENVVGVVKAKDLLARCLAEEPIELMTLSQTPLFVPESMRVWRLLERFKQTGVHAAVVVDEYGGTAGLATPTDILEALVGEIPTVAELAEPQAVQREDGSWLIDGTLSVDDFKDIFQIKELPEEERGDYETLGGFVMTYLRSVPTAGDHFEWNGLRFEVMDMDGQRVDKVLVAARKQPSEPSNDL